MLTEGVRRYADVPESDIADARTDAMEHATSCGVPTDVADRIIKEAEQNTIRFADALIAARKIAEEIVDLSDKHDEELRKYVRTE